MLLKTVAPLVFVIVSSMALAATDDVACGTLVGTGNSPVSGGFQLRGGESVDFVAGGKTVHGTLLVMADGSLYRAYWQPQGSPEKYVLSGAGTNSIRLISTPTQGVPAGSGQPGTTLPPQRVVSCPVL